MAIPSEHAGTWLERFSGALPIHLEGGLHVYRALHEGGPCLVVVGGADESAERTRARLDGIAAAHARLSHARIPRLIERGRVGEVEFLALACPAVATLHAVVLHWEKLLGPIDEARFAAVVLAMSEPIGAAHATVGDQGTPICLGIVSWGKMVVSSDGEIWIWGFGDRFLDRRLSMRDSLGQFVAPEAVRGAVPSPAGDLYAMYQLVQEVHDTMVPPEGLQRVLMGAPLPEDRELAALIADFTGRIFSGDPTARHQTVAEVLAVAQRMWALTGDRPDAEGMRRIVVDYCRQLQASDETMLRPIGPDRGAHVWDRGRYRSERELGRGGMGTVYLAWDRELEQRVALKTLRADASPSLRQRFVREVRLMRTLRHPSLVSGYDLVQEGDELAAVMEYVPGPALSQVIGTLADPKRAASTVAAIADALVCLHEAGVVHRDVKPANVIVHERRGPVLVDLGVASEENSQLTHTGVLVGTPLYMAPEQLGGGRAEAHSDVYAACLVLLEALRGAHPFPAGSVLDAMVARAASLDALFDARLPEPLAPLVRRALSLRPEARPSAAELRDALRQFALS